MINITNIFTRTYIVSENSQFLIDISINTNTDIYEAFIYNVNYGIKMHMFGLDNVNFDRFKKLVEDNYQYYIEIYKKRYMF